LIESEWLYRKEIVALVSQGKRYRHKVVVNLYILELAQSVMV